MRSCGERTCASCNQLPVATAVGGALFVYLRYPVAVHQRAIALPPAPGAVGHQDLELGDLTRRARHPLHTLLGGDVVVLDAHADILVEAHQRPKPGRDLPVARRVWHLVEHVLANVDTRLDRERAPGSDSGSVVVLLRIVHVEADAV